MTIQHLSSKLRLIALLLTFHFNSFAQVGVSGVANFNFQNTVLGINQLAYFGNTDFRLSATFSLYFNRPNALKLVNIGASSSNVRNLDKAYIFTQFFSIGYARLKSNKLLGQQAYVGGGLDLSTAVTQTLSDLNTRKTIREGNFGDVLKVTPYVQVRLPLKESKSGFNPIMDTKIGIDLFGITNSNGTYNPMYFIAVGFGICKNFNKNPN